MVLASLLLGLGGLALAVGGPDGLMLAARLAAGIGGVLINVLATKMAADWFPSDHRVLAIGILITSWPVGLALAMGLLPWLAGTVGLGIALGIPALCALAAALLFAFAWRATPSSGGPAPSPTPLSRPERRFAIAAGTLWGAFNAGGILVLSFGPASVTGANPEALFSLTGWLAIPAMVVLAPWAERKGIALLTIAASLALFIAATALLPVAPTLPLIVVAGPRVRPPRPADHEPPRDRDRPRKTHPRLRPLLHNLLHPDGRLPPLAGALRDATGSATAPLWIAIAAFALALAALADIRRRPAQIT